MIEDATKLDADLCHEFDALATCPGYQWNAADQDAGNMQRQRYIAQHDPGRTDQSRDAGDSWLVQCLSDVFPQTQQES